MDVAEFYSDQGGGVRTYINAKLEHAGRLGHRMVVVAPGSEDREEERLGGKIVWVKGPPLPWDSRYHAMLNEGAVHAVLDREQPDLVEGSSPWTGGWFAARWPGRAPRSFIYHSDPIAILPHLYLDRLFSPGVVDRLFWWFWVYLWFLTSRYQATVVAGDWMARKLRGLGLKRVETVPFGIDKACFSPQRRDPELRAELCRQCEVPPDAPLLVNVSRFHPEKRLKTVIQGFARASRERPMGLVIFGDGPKRHRVERWVVGVPHIHLAGYTAHREELARALASCDLMIHGSAAETFGLAIAEGLCSGLPLVVPNVGGAADLADPAWSETYPPGRSGALGAAILKMLDREVRPQAEGRVRSHEEHFEALFELYARLVREHR